MAEPYDFEKQLLAARMRLDSLRARAQSEDATSGTLSEAIEELGSTLEELHVAVEELRESGQQLVAVRDQAEEERRRLSTLFDGAPLAYVLLTPEGAVVTANQAAADALGILQSHLRGKPLRLFFDAHDREALDLCLKAMRDGGEAPGDRARLTVIPRGARDPFAVSLRGNAVRDVRGRVTGLRLLWREEPEG